MHGILSVNKPEGISSFDVVRHVRRVFQTRKVGHGGTLDPLATGVLPVAVGSGTRLLEFLMEGKKSYLATMQLGQTTDTQDSQGTVSEERSTAAVTAEMVQTLLTSTTGEIEQLPPMYSALKHQGQPLYKLARQGIEIERKPRKIFIDSIEVVSITVPEVTFSVTCSKGTYVRTLIHDFGQALGCGAHMTALQRTATLPFTLEHSIDFAELLPGEIPDKGWFSLFQAVEQLPQVAADEKAVALLKDGVPPRLDQVVIAEEVLAGQLVAISAAGRLLALARYAPEGALDQRGDFSLLKVFHY